MRITHNEVFRLLIWVSLSYPRTGLGLLRGGTCSWHKSVRITNGEASVLLRAAHWH